MEIPRELILNSDACDGYKCTFTQNDCREAHPLTWMKYRNGVSLCPCAQCILFNKFKESNITLLEFREYLYNVRFEITLDDIWND